MPILPNSLMKLWNKWELRVMVLLSLSLQILLILLGNRRKYTAKSWVGVIIWLAYLSADWLATVSIGILMNQEDCEDKSPATNYVIMAFWAPFLLVHLGGPDTITAYSLEDNELWLRHFLGLLTQFGGAFYVFLKSWEGEALNFLAIPVFIIGLIKYGERTWILRSASSDHFRDAMLPRPDPAAINSIVPDAAILQAAYYFFNNFKRLFADLILSFQDRQDSQSFFQSTSWEEVFRVIETELGFMYDVLYTKAVVIYSRLGSLLRWIVIEMYAIAVLLSSDWTELWLSKHKNPWSDSMAQHNLISICLKEKPVRCSGVQKFLGIYEALQGHQCKNSKVSPDLKRLIFEILQEKSRGASDIEACKRICSQRGDNVLEKMNCLPKFDWSIIKVEFDQSILLWHIATDLCYYADLNKNPNSDSLLFDACRLAKCLQSLETEEQWQCEQKWEMMSHVWVEMLSHAAGQCQWNHHAKQLGQGGELLTHVWLLMAHFGITEHFQISQGHARARLVVS
ncbi:unnamed protein product, partial [Vitis vinifera]